MRERLSLTRKNEIVNITAKMEAAVASSIVEEGICLVYAVENGVLSSLFNLVPKRQVVG